MEKQLTKDILDKINLSTIISQGPTAYPREVYEKRLEFAINELEKRKEKK